MGTLKVGSYELVKLLGEGGMGSVYEGYHVESKQRVAVKIINADVAAHETVLARFELEARAAAAIQSPFVARVLDFGREQGAPFLVMELLEGKDLETVFDEHRLLPPELVVRFATQCCLGLQRAHERGIIHRDVKPANLILAEQAGSKDLILKILDFGIAKVRDDEWQALEAAPLTRTGSLLGSPRYMSPEQARGYKNIDPRTDLFSLAVVMYQALTGHTPHHRVEAMGDLIVTLCSDPAPPLGAQAPWVDRRLARIVARALAINVGDRYASAAEMAKDLVEIIPREQTIPRALLRTFEPDLAAVASTLPNPAALAALAPPAATPGPTPRESSSDKATVDGVTAPAVVSATRTVSTPKSPSQASSEEADAFPLAWVGAGILFSLVVGVGSVAAGVIPLPSRQEASSTRQAPSADATASSAISSVSKSAASPLATSPAPAAASAAPPPSSASGAATPEPSAAASAKPALTGHLPTALPAPSAVPKPSSAPASTGAPPATPSPPTPPSPFPSDSPL